MDGIFNSPFMVKLQEFGQKLGSNKFLSALQGSMMSCMAPIMVGAIFSIICAVGPMFGIFQNGDAVYNVLYMPSLYNGFIVIVDRIDHGLQLWKSIRIEITNHDKCADSRMFRTHRMYMGNK